MMDKAYCPECQVEMVELDFTIGKHKKDYICPQCLKIFGKLSDKEMIKIDKPENTISPDEFYNTHFREDDRK